MDRGREERGAFSRVMADDILYRTMGGADCGCASAISVVERGPSAGAGGGWRIH